ncbi:MAG: glutaredoxin 3 [Pseudomonadota bacterium]|nr:glutaredoxin 3 [Pseudomonadota bacterium]
MSKVLMYSKKVCPYCVSAKRLLQNKGIAFEEILIDDRPDLYEELKTKTGHLTVPQVFINDTFIGGYAELKALEDEGKLDQL